VVIKNVTLRGQNTGGGLPEINAGGSGSAVEIAVNGTTIEGFNLTHSGHCGCGMLAYQYSPAIIQSSTISSTRSTEYTFGKEKITP
jgi:hypothetical protein